MSKKLTVIILLASAAMLSFALAYSLSCKNSGYRISVGDFFDGIVGRSSNCGGNSAALSVCYEVSLCAFAIAQTNSTKADFRDLTPELADVLRSRISSPWTAGAKYLLLTEKFECSTSNREIIVVCDKAYGNIPQPSLWNL